MRSTLGVGCLCLLLGGCQPEPRHEGFPKSYWIQELKTPSKASSRIHVVSAIAHFGPEAREAIPYLTPLLKNNDPVLRWAAAGALGRMGHHAKSAIPALREMEAKESYRPTREEAHNAIRRIEGEELESSGRPGS